MSARTGQRRGILEIATPSAHAEVTLRWRISGDAIRALRPDLDVGEGDAALCIRVTLDERARPRRVCASRATLESAHAVACPIEHAQGPGAWWRDDPMIHIDVQGLVCATIRARQGEPAKLLYARTPLLAAIGLPPGVYDPDGCDVELQSP
jgi:hypothetical protein